MPLGQRSTHVLGCPWDGMPLIEEAIREIQKSYFKDIPRLAAK